MIVEGTLLRCIEKQKMMKMQVSLNKEALLSVLCMLRATPALANHFIVATALMVKMPKIPEAVCIKLGLHITSNNLSIISLIWSIKCHYTIKNANQDFPKPNVTYSHSLLNVSLGQIYLVQYIRRLNKQQMNINNLKPGISARTKPRVLRHSGVLN